MAEPETPPPADEQDNADSLEASDSQDVQADSLEETPAGNDATTQATDSNEAGSGSSQTIDATSSAGTAAAPPPKPQKPGGLKQLLHRFNIYLLLFVFLLVVAGVIVTVAYLQTKKASTAATLKTQNLTQSTLEKIANSDATVGSSQQVLNVESSAVFAGKVLIRDDLEVAGNLDIGGTVALNGLTVSGTTQLGQTQINNNLSVAGNTGIQGSATVAKSLQVNGSGTFSGALSAPQLTTSTLQLNGDLTLMHHIIAGGPDPSLSNGPALGGGGTTSVSGSDTGGYISINTGNSPAAGCFVTVNFTGKYNSTPYVLLTPVGTKGGGLAYYVNRSTTSFSICDASAPPAGASFGFDYFVID